MQSVKSAIMAARALSWFKPLPQERIDPIRVAWRVSLLAAAAVVAALILRYQPGLADIKHAVEPLTTVVARWPFQAALLFLAANIAVTGACIPIEIVFGLAAGALFGLVEGTILVSFASSIGATIGFWLSRFLLRDVVGRLFSRQIRIVNEGIARDGAFYLFALRMLPFLPYSLTNLLMGLTEMPARKFYWVSQLGMLPATVVYVNAGTQLAHLDNLSGVVSPRMIGAFALLAMLPWMAKGLLHLWRKYAEN